MAIKIYPDTNVKSSAFKHFEVGVLLVASQFLTLQGEGPFAGKRAYFIRLSGCNYGAKEGYCGGGTGLGCDTDFRMAQGFPYKSEALVANVKLHNAKLVVITGGEPLLQSRSLKFLIAQLSAAGVTVQIETNGVFHKDFDRILPPPHIVCSPKAHELRGYSSTLINTLLEKHEANKNLYLKFLVGDYPYCDLPFAPSHLSDDQRKRVYLSPITVYTAAYQGELGNSWNPNLVDQTRTAANHHAAANLCIEHDLVFSMQTHNFCGQP